MMKRPDCLRMVWGLCVLLVAMLAGARPVAGMETVKARPDNAGFVLDPSGTRFVPWGHNYTPVNILKRVAEDEARVESDFAEMKQAGATVVRVHPEMPRIMVGPNKVDPAAITNLEKLLAIAARTDLHLMITGLACYRIADRMDWYDAMDEEERWQTQAFYWETIARACCRSPAVFAYDLVNEPAAVGKLSDGWYMGRMGDVEFCQRLCLDPGTRSGDDIMRTWTKRMVDAIRTHDKAHLVTMGMLPFPGAYKAAVEHLDFVSPHLYPKAGKVDEEIALLRRFAGGKPIVIGETFPLTCGVDDERTFLLESREIAHGWLGQWPEMPPSKLAAARDAGTATIPEAIWLSWVELFQEIGPEMTGE